MSLTFQGSDVYRTQVGAVITILVTVMLISFGAFRLLSINNENIQQIVVHEDSLMELETGSPRAVPLSIVAFGLGDELVDPTIGEFKL